MTARIVVGVDGSPESLAALAEAVEQARLRDGLVQAVYAWLPAAHVAPYGYVGYMTPRHELEQAAQELLADAIKDVPEDVQVECLAVEGPVAPALIELSQDADLLVVGSRGRGGFAGLLLGSTSHSVISHAACPVLVVRAEHDAGMVGEVTVEEG